MAAADADADAKADAEPGYGRHFGYKRYGWGGYGKGGYGYKGHSKSYVRQHRPRPVQKCHTVYDTTYEKVCKTISKPVCTLVPTTQYRTEVDNVCTNVPEKVCVPTQQTVPGEPACTTHTEQACSVDVQTVVDTVVQQECQDIQHQVRCYYIKLSNQLDILPKVNL